MLKIVLVKLYCAILTKHFMDNPSTIDDTITLKQLYELTTQVLFKDSAFKPSFPCRHAAELGAILQPSTMDYPELCLYRTFQIGCQNHKIKVISCANKLDKKSASDQV